ncbi:hypothetical protein CVT25_009436 [Psilocybe cyanescens]|uniref:Uncharacterized protein n=1 Tax=Psilocybe cyanescens TaxID=93625 RepID=A0A409XV73_PSICY|nr:hypothetical protein CVT25_009436 [Psilocybe cyanescens]
MSFKATNTSESGGNTLEREDNESEVSDDERIEGAKWRIMLYANALMDLAGGSYLPTHLAMVSGSIKNIIIDEDTKGVVVNAPYRAPFFFELDDNKTESNINHSKDESIEVQQADIDQQNEIDQESETDPDLEATDLRKISVPAFAQPAFITDLFINWLKLQLVLLGPEPPKEKLMWSDLFTDPQLIREVAGTSGKSNQAIIDYLTKGSTAHTTLKRIQDLFGSNAQHTSQTICDAATEML